jgi:hypothetical protein
MKKLLLSTAIAIFAIANVNAQSVNFGAKAGLNLANVGGDIDENEGIVGFHIGGVAEISISEKFSIQPELLFSAQGTKFEEGDGKLTMKLNYINIPVMAKYYVADGFSLEAGPQIGILASAKAKYEIGGESESEDIKDNFESLDLGLNFGLGYKLDSGLNFAARYNLGLSNLAKDSGNEKINNGVFQLSVGYMF